MNHRTFWLAREGNRPEEWEDAFAADAARGRFAVADGAAGSVFASSWAHWLADRYLEAAECDADLWAAWLPRVQEAWTVKFRGQQFPWYTEAKMEHGAFATFLGLVVSDLEGAGGQWKAVAVGDSCLFHTREGRMLQAFPVQRAAQFSNSPPLLGSKTPPSEVRERRAASMEGSAKRWDRLWMMTDALAQWCLAEEEAGRAPWDELEHFLTPTAAPEEMAEDFASWIAELRSGRRLKNDDVTLLGISL